MTRFILGMLRDATRGRTGTRSAGPRPPGGERIVELPIDVASDPLAGFDPEDEATTGRSAGAAMRARHQVARARRDGEPFGLDEVLARSNTLLWVEAVAILEAVCRALTDGEQQPSVPEALSEISITSEGSVLVRPARTDGPAGPRLARILLTLTAGATVPVPLRLFITKWASFAEPHSIADFAQELAYFARPEGQALIQGVYVRCQAATPQSQFPVEKVVDTSLTPMRTSSRQRSGHMKFVVGAAGGAAVLVGALWLWTSSSLWKGADMAGRQPSTGTLAVAPTTPSDKPGITRVAPAGAGETSSSSRNGSVSTPTVSRVARTSASSRPEVESMRSFPDLPRREFVPTAPTPATDDLSTPASSDERVAAADAAAFTASDDGASIEPTDRSTIYSSADHDVQPPMIIDASLPGPILAGVNPTNTMELVISEQGVVERVRLVSEPHRMADMMLLSGAKTWRFEPASLDGRSVRYRLRLSWAATP